MNFFSNFDINKITFLYYMGITSSSEEVKELLISSCQINLIYLKQSRVDIIGVVLDNVLESKLTLCENCGIKERIYRTS